jgi:hypothetical protein
VNIRLKETPDWLESEKKFTTGSRSVYIPFLHFESSRKSISKLFQRNGTAF